MSSGPKRFLFVGGIARSGTSTMADLLRAHPLIAMGRERYAWLFEREALLPALFEKERFCQDHRSDDSHHLRPQPYYDDLYPRFDQCVYVGDKYPSLYKRYRYLIDTFPGVRIIYMARNAVDVARSWEARALETRAELERGADVDLARRWSPERGWRSAIDDWNASIAQTLAFGRPQQLFVADYDALYRDGRLLERLLAFLELPAAPAMLEQWRAAGAERERIESAREPLLSEAAVREIGARANLAQFDRLRGVA